MKRPDRVGQRDGADEDVAEVGGDEDGGAVGGYEWPRGLKPAALRAALCG